MSGDDIANQRQQFGGIYVSHFSFWVKAGGLRLFLLGRSGRAATFPFGSKRAGCDERGSLSELVPSSAVLGMEDPCRALPLL
jgi:hypothetical protein